jgi:hypothetical protein
MRIECDGRLEPAVAEFASADDVGSLPYPTSFANPSTSASLTIGELLPVCTVLINPVMYGKPNVLILHQIPPGHARLWITPRRSRQSPHIFTGQPCSLARSNKARSSCTCMAHSSRATS